LTYLGDQNNQYEHWGYNTYGRRDKGGDFCISCPWRFTAQAWNPWIYVNYWDSGDGWDVDLNVIGISTPPPRRLYTAAQKDNAHLWYTISINATVGIGETAVVGCAVSPGLGCLALTVGTGIAGGFAWYFGTKVNDPWDDWYQYPAEPVIRDASEYGWWWTGDSDADALTYAGIVIQAYAEAGVTTINRASTCLAQNDNCADWQIQRLHDIDGVLGWWSRYASGDLEILRGRTDNPDVAAALEYGRQVTWGISDFLFSGQ